MSLGEIARCLFKPRWADLHEHKKALAAFARLSPSQQELVEKMGSVYSK